MKNAFAAFSRALANHVAFDATEAKHLATIRQFVSENSDAFWQRTTLAGHVTGSAFVINAARTHTLLLHHAKLNRWVQPGGHLDDSDDSPARGALREALEETGIAALLLASEDIFDVDVHAIPERNKSGDPSQHEPAHFHHDARYLVIANETTVALSDESLGFRWVELATLATGNHESGLVRMAKKVIEGQ
jgi:8-oxo-dGTP pyrophosphatase MutT (NUDIX family)